METAPRSAVVKWSLIIGIIIVLNLFFNYAISLAFKAPQYSDYVPQPVSSQPINTEKDCRVVGGQWTASGKDGYCNPDYTKEQQFQSAMKDYDRSVFILLVLLGVASIIVGALLEHIILSSAFSWGGVLSLVIASMRYWSDADNVLKVIILAVALGGLIWTAIKKFS